MKAAVWAVLSALHCTCGSNFWARGWNTKVWQHSICWIYTKATEQSARIQFVHNVNVDVIAPIHHHFTARVVITFEAGNEMHIKPKPSQIKCKLVVDEQFSLRLFDFLFRKIELGLLFRFLSWLHLVVSRRGLCSKYTSKQTTKQSNTATNWNK